MTPQQHKCLTYVTDYIRVNGYSPSYAEIMGHLQLESLSGVYRIVNALERDGYITTRKASARSIMPTSGTCEGAYARICAIYGPEAVRAEAMRT